MNTAFLIATNRCSRECPFCFYSTGYLDYPAAELAAREMLEAVDRIAGMGAGELIITGGEPLLRSDIMEIVERAGRHGLSRLLLTNGDLLVESAAERLLRSGIGGITLSLTSMAEVRRIEKAAILLRDTRSTSVTVTIVFSGSNVDELPLIYRWARGMGWGVILQPAFIPRESEEYDRLSPHRFSSAQWADLTNLLREWGRRQGILSYIDYILALYGRGAARPKRCIMGANALVIDCDGSVFPCFHRRDMPAGNILTTPTDEIAANLAECARGVRAASCYGEHCVSLFSRSGG